MTDVLGTALTQPATTAAVKKQGYVGTYMVSQDLSSSGPLVVVDAISPSPAQSKALAKKVTSMIRPTLDNLQKAAGVDSTSAYVKSLTINPADRATSVTKNRVRALLAAFAVGLVLMILAVIGVDRWSERRRRKSTPPPEIVEPRDGPRPIFDPKPRRPAPLAGGDWSARAKAVKAPTSIAANGTDTPTTLRRKPRHSIPAPPVNGR